MKPIILFRKTLAEEGEFEIAKKYFEVVEQRTLIPENALVIGRYSCLPYYRELEQDINNLNSTLINTYNEHQYIANFDYYADIKHITPKTWFSPSEVFMEGAAGPFVLKGTTNSRKQMWKTAMFAKDKSEMMNVYGRLLDDSLISHQNIIIREFVELENYGTNEITGIPIAKEFRCFFHRNKLLAKGYYWTNHLEEIGFTPDADEIPPAFLHEITKKVGLNATFWVADVAQKKDGSWCVVEINDGQQSGIAGVNVDELYENLLKNITLI